MSVNIDVFFRVRNLRDERERAGVAALLTDVLDSERLALSVAITLGEEADDLYVQADSDEAISFSGFYRWVPEFERTLTDRVVALVPHARLDFGWEYADED
ncbi:hypothetical protein AB0H71_32095 [Nocardia sp. NPDC050697]|uniref:hypothetical protein n=1 Tax=Nocardia sp. NPDC050697 TaxID=3155158 RepID=UPI0033D6ABA5